MQQTKQKQLGNYIFEKTLGHGTFGKVKLAIHRPTGQYVAIKILNKAKIIDGADVERVARQIHILKLIRHPNIIQLYEIIETSKYLFLIMEYVEGGELFNYIVKKKKIEQREACRLFHQLINGIEYISKLGIVHRDLKPENLMLDYQNALKIVDFGLSNTYQEGQTLKTPCGSPCYAAPQMIKGEKYEGLKADIWSSGVILFAMVCGCLPFEDENTSHLFKKIIAGKYTPSSSISSDCKSIIAGVLEVNPSKRLSVDEIRSHPWMSLNYTPDNKGIIIGVNRIPIQPKVLKRIQITCDIDTQYVVKCVESNRYNNASTTYYLSFKKFIREGGLSNCDMNSPNFDKTLLQPHRRSRDDPDFALGSDATTVKVTGDFFDSIKSPSSFTKFNKTRNNQIQFRSTEGAKRHSRKKSIVHNKSISKSKDKINQSMLRGRSIDKGYNKISKKYKQRYNKSMLSKSNQKRNLSIKPKKSSHSKKQSKMNRSSLMMRSMSKDKCKNKQRSKLGEITNAFGMDSIDISESNKSYTRGKSIFNNRRIVFNERESFQTFTKRSKM